MRAMMIAMKICAPLLFVFAASAWALAGGVAWAGQTSPPATAKAGKIDAMIHRLWAGYKDKCREDFARRMKAGDVYGLYDTQRLLNNLQQYAADNKDVTILNDLAGIYLEALPALHRDKDGFQKWLFTSKNTQDAKENPRLVGGEVKLCSSQFLYAVSSLLRTTAGIDAARRTEAMKQLCEEFPTVIVRDHYLRWFPDDIRRWRKQLPAEPGANGKRGNVLVSDTQMWVLAGVANILAANKADDKVVPLTVDEKKAFLDFVDLGTKVLKFRMSISHLKDLQGRDVEGLDFDRGMWDPNPEYAYAGYTGQRYPTKQDKKPAKGLGWDISHARRFVDVFDTLYETRGITGQTFPDERTMKGLANQVAYGAFNRDLKHPLWTNFMDGTNGWYRVGYAGRKNFGYAPYMLSHSIPDGGYGFWTRFNPDIGLELKAFWQWCKHAEKDNDPLFVKYYGEGYFPNNIGNAPRLLMFLPTIAR